MLYNLPLPKYRFLLTGTSGVLCLVIFATCGICFNLSLYIEVVCLRKKAELEMSQGHWGRDRENERNAKGL